MPAVRSRLLVLVGVAVTTLMVAFAVTGPLGGRLRSAAAELGEANMPQLALSALLSAVALVLASLAWRSALASCGSPLGRMDAVSRYAAGSACNAVAPIRLGGTLRFGLFAKASSVRRATAAAAAVSAARSAWLLPLAAGAWASGLLAAWAALLLAAGATVLGVVAALVGRRLAILPSAARWIGMATLARVGAAAASGAAVGAPRPLLAALLVIPACDLAATLPLAPGALGLGTAACALAFGLAGAGVGVALAAGLALTLAETAASLALGGIGAAWLSGFRLRRGKLAQEARQVGLGTAAAAAHPATG